MDDTSTVDPDALLAAAVADETSYDDTQAVPEIEDVPAEPGTESIPTQDVEPDLPVETPAEAPVEAPAVGTLDTPAEAPDAPPAPEAPAAPEAPDADAAAATDAEPKEKKPREYKYNAEDLIKILRNAVKLNDGKVPGIRQAYAKELGLVQPQHYIRVFGDWNSGIEAAGKVDLGDGAGTFEPNRKGTKGSGRKKGIPNRTPEEIAAAKAQEEADKAERKAKREAEKAQRDAEKAAKKAADDAAKAAAAEAERVAAEAAGSTPDAPAPAEGGDVAANVAASSDTGTVEAPAAPVAPEAPAAPAS